jgi:hypothetical protein
MCREEREKRDRKEEGRRWVWWWCGGVVGVWWCGVVVVVVWGGGVVVVCGGGVVYTVWTSDLTRSCELT